MRHRKPIAPASSSAIRSAPHAAELINMATDLTCRTDLIRVRTSSRFSGGKRRMPALGVSMRLPAKAMIITRQP